MTGAWLLAAALLAADDDQPEHYDTPLTTTVKQYVDMNGEYGRPAYLYLQPLSVSAGALFAGDRVSPVASASILGLRAASRWGELDVLPLEAVSTPTRFGFGGTFLHAEQYLCRDVETQSYRPLPIWEELRGAVSINNCVDNERWGAFAETGRFWAHPDDKHFAVRWGEGGVLLDALAHGRSYDLRRTRLDFMLGAAFDSVWFGSSYDWAPRGVLRLRGTFTSSDSRFRALVDVAWRPSVIRFDDHLVEGTLTAGVFFMPEIKNALFLRLRGRVSVSTRPGMVTAEWADPATPVTGTVDLGVEVTFGG